MHLMKITETSTLTKTSLGKAQKSPKTPIASANNLQTTKKMNAMDIVDKMLFGRTREEKETKELVFVGLQILKGTFESEVETEFVKSPEEHINEAKKYGSFENYQKAEWTSEKVSSRIINFSIARFEQWHTQHQDLSRDEAMEKFAKIVTDASQKGYDRAMKILGDKVPDDIKAELSKTLQLTHEGFKNWHGSQTTVLQAEAKNVT